MSYEKIAKDVLKSVGGEENITSVVHCATRLRFKLKDRKRVDKNETEGIEGVISVVESGGQYQVVIGNTVGDVYKEITKITKFGDDDAPQSSSSDGSIFNKTVDIIAGIFTPFLGALAASGILKGLLIMLDTAGILSADTGAYRIWFATADAIFYFLPLLIAVTSARKFGANIYVALGVAGALVHPNIVAMNSAGEAIDFFSIPVVMMSYTSSVIPVILAIWVLSLFEKWLNNKLHPNVKNFLTPLFSIMTVVPITLIVFGPFGTYLSQWLATGTTFIYDLSPIAAGIVMGIGWQILVIFGLHWAFIPIMYNNIAVQGFDKLKPLFAPSNFAQAGAALGVFLKTKNPKVKGIAGAAAVTGIFGITEPIIYGITLRYKKPFLWAALGGGLGGAIAGASGSVALAPGIPSVVTIPIFFGTGFAGFIVAIIVAYFFSAIATYFFGYNDSMENELASEKSSEKKDELKIDTAVKASNDIVSSPISGQVTSLSEVKDEVFSKGMLGKGVAVIPSEGKVYSPVSGRVATAFPTGHAIGLHSDTGTELLIHVGLETVELEGKHFTLHVKQGDIIKKGQLLVEFDLDEIKKLGYDITTPIVITNATAEMLIIRTNAENVKMNDELFKIKNK